jgi:hypothetical protein
MKIILVTIAAIAIGCAARQTVERYNEYDQTVPTIEREIIEAESAGDLDRSLELRLELERVKGARDEAKARMNEERGKGWESALATVGGLTETLAPLLAGALGPLGVNLLSVAGGALKKVKVVS